MGRSRSRSPPGRRERHRSRSRERERDHDRRVRGRYRSRSPSPRRRRSSRSPPIRRRSRSRSWSPPRNRRSRSSSRNIELEQKGTSDNQNRGRDSNREAPKRAVSKFLMERTPITEKDLEGKTDEEKEMMKLMGFGNFDTTKGKHVAGNVAYGTHVIQKRKYRQYMNRKGGFNRPLDFVA